MTKSLDYKVAIEIDIDCEELLDAIGLDYTESEDDDTQNVIWITLTKDEFKEVLEDVLERWTIDNTFPNEQDVATALLNPELGEYTTKVRVYTPDGDTLTFE